MVSLPKFIEVMWGPATLLNRSFRKSTSEKSYLLETYGFPPVLHQDIGLNQSGKTYYKTTIYKKLAERNLLAIATGRPRTEALYPLILLG